MKKLSYVGLCLIGMSLSLSAGVIDKYQKACDDGDTKECNRLGVLYVKGEGVNQSYAKAKELFNKSCNFGDTEGCKKYTKTNSLMKHMNSGIVLYENKQEYSSSETNEASNHKIKVIKTVESKTILMLEPSKNINKKEADQSKDWTAIILDQSSQLYDGLKTKTINLYNDDLETVMINTEKTKQQRENKIWNDVLEKLKEGASYAEKLNSAPKSAWFVTDKDDIQDDINQVLDDIMETLTGDDLLLYKNRIAFLKKKIYKNKSNILNYRENKIGAPDQSTFETTKVDYNNKIEEAKVENRKYENNIKIVKDNLKKNFSEVGVTLTSEQIDVLLTRVDGDDIIQMSLIMDVLKHITSQIMYLMKESNEELSQSKKYYGMHLVSLELIVYIQQKYITEVDNVYIPKINVIMISAEKMIAETNNLKSSEKDSRRKAIYEKNIEAQMLTYKVAKLYKHDLIKSKNNMFNAQKISKNNLILSKNIYATVLLSADLYELVSESQNMFEEISKIQVPDIVPFENIQIQKKYKELTGLLQEE